MPEYVEERGTRQNKRKVHFRQLFLIAHENLNLSKELILQKMVNLK
jgi:hypothetical protein